MNRIWEHSRSASTNEKMKVDFHIIRIWGCLVSFDRWFFVLHYSCWCLVNLTKVDVLYIDRLTRILDFLNHLSVLVLSRNEEHVQHIDMSQRMAAFLFKEIAMMITHDVMCEREKGCYLETGCVGVIYRDKISLCQNQWCVLFFYWNLSRVLNFLAWCHDECILDRGWTEECEWLVKRS